MIRQFLKDQNGQTTVEYLLIIMVIVVVISVAGKQLKDQIPLVVQRIFKNVNGKIDQLMQGAMQN